MGEYKLEFTINGLPEITLNGNYAHWRRRSNRRQYWQREVRHAVMNKEPKEPLKKAKVTLSRFSTREPDFDGLVCSFKPILDGLTNSKIIIDDKMSVIGQPTYKWEKIGKGKGKIHILVEELPMEGK